LTSVYLVWLAHDRFIWFVTVDLKRLKLVVKDFGFGAVGIALFGGLQEGLVMLWALKAIVAQFIF